MLINGVEVPEKTAWHPRLGKKEKKIDESRLGGLPYLAPGEEPPECGICGRSMALLMQLRGSDDPRPEPERLAQDDMLQVFWCPGECCFEPDEAFSETGKSRQARMVKVTNEGIEHTREWRAGFARTLAERCSSSEAAESFAKRYARARTDSSRAGLIYEFEAQQGSHGQDSDVGADPKEPYDPVEAALERALSSSTTRRSWIGPPWHISGWKPVQETPSSMSDLIHELDASEEWQETFADEMLDQCSDNTRLGGFPFVIQDEVSASCPVCDRPAEFLLQLQFEALEPVSLFGNGWLFVCPDHPTRISFPWRADP